MDDDSLQKVIAELETAASFRLDRPDWPVGARADAEKWAARLSALWERLLKEANWIDVPPTHSYANRLRSIAGGQPE